MRHLFARANIRSKIIAAFALVLCCTAGLGLFAVQRLAAVNASAAEIRENWLPSTQLLGQMAQLAERLRLNQYNAATTSSEERRELMKKQIADFTARFEHAHAAYVSLVSAGEEQAFAKAISTSWNSYKGFSNTLNEIIAKGDFIQAVLLLDQMNPAMNEFRKALQDDIAFNAREGKRAADVGAALGGSARIWVLAVLGLMVLVCASLGWSLVRGISGPVTAMTAAMRRLADQDLAVAVPGVGRGDEIGAMAGAVQVFKDNALRAQALEREQAEAQARRAAEDERVRVEAEQAAEAEAAALVVGSIGKGLECLAEGDLTHRLDAALPPAYEPLRANLNKAIEQLRGLVGGIAANAHAIRSGTGEIAQASDDLSRRTEQQAASLEQTAAALDQITATVRKTAEGAKQARDVAARTRSDAERSGEVVRQAVGAMGEIERSSQQIGQIIGVIDEIAFQTNLLALNAGVEAARAGEAGRGFAVVASEVRALAQRSAEAAREIKALISASGRQVGAGVALVGEAGQALGRIVGQVAEVNAAVAEIAGSAQEQATGLSEVNTAVNQMDQVTQQNAAMVEQSTAAAHALSRETDELARLTGRFRLGDSTDGAALAPAASAAPLRRPAKPAAPRPARTAPALKVVGQGRSQEGGKQDWKEF